MLLYRVLVTVFATIVLIRLGLRGKWTAIRARLGGGRKATRPCLWVHAASNGELTSMRAMIEALREVRPGLPMMITCNSDTGVALAKTMLSDGDRAQLAPLDLGWVVRRFQKRFQVLGLLTCESEIWPNRVLRTKGPVFVVGARMTPKTARGWRWFGGYGRFVMANVDLLSAQDPGSQERLLKLGVREKALLPVVDLKRNYLPPDGAGPDAALTAAFPRKDTWLAASTHPGEEEIVADVAKALGAKARLILAPRHARRGDEIAAMLRSKGLAVAQRSKNEPPWPGAVYLADTMGEMPLWYQLAGRVFIGGSISIPDGHTPYESAYFEQAILHGPGMTNHEAAYHDLHQAGAAVQVETAEQLRQALTDLADPAQQEKLGKAAKAAFETGSDVTCIAKKIGKRLPKRLDGR